MAAFSSRIQWRELKEKFVLVNAAVQKIAHSYFISNLRNAGNRSTIHVKFIDTSPGGWVDIKTHHIQQRNLSYFVTRNSPAFPTPLSFYFQGSFFFLSFLWGFSSLLQGFCDLLSFEELVLFQRWKCKRKAYREDPLEIRSRVRHR